jgi:hypothetical protein
VARKATGSTRRLVAEPFPCSSRSSLSSKPVAAVSAETPTRHTPRPAAGGVTSLVDTTERWVRAVVASPTSEVSLRSSSLSIARAYLLPKT